MMMAEDLSDGDWEAILGSMTCKNPITNGTTEMMDYKIPPLDNSGRMDKPQQLCLNPAFQLSAQFAAICKEVMISDQELQIHTDALERIAKIAKERNPRVEVTTLFRHNYTGLRNAGSNQLLVFLSEQKYRALGMKRPEIEELFQGSELTALPRHRLPEVEAGFPYIDKKSGRLVGVVTHSDHLAEVVTCQLVNHLLKYDPRAKSLLTLVHYWARVNHITLSTNQNLRSDISSLPDPAALEWLCVFFLANRKVIPSLKTLQARTKQRKDLINVGRPGPASASFSYYPGFEKEWKATKLRNCPAGGSCEYVLNVLRLALDFFTFFSRKDLKGKVLNSSNGEEVPVLWAIEEGLIEPSLSSDKCQYDSRSFDVTRKKALMLEAEFKQEIYLMQPFRNLRFKFCQDKFDKSIRPQIETTANKLKFYLKDVDEIKNNMIYEIDLTSLFKCNEGIVQHIKIVEIPTLVPVGMSILASSSRSSRSMDDNYLEDEQALNQDECLEIQVEVQPSIVRQKELKVHKLSAQFDAIRKEVEIPDEDFKRTADLLKKIQNSFKMHKEEVQATLFRHHYLKLRDGGSNRVLIYLTRPFYKPLYMKRQQLEVFFQEPSLKPVTKSKKYSEIGVPFMDMESGLNFELEIHSGQLVEVVTCQLAKYLLEFDPRARSLLTLVHYWAIQNSVTLSKTGFIPMQEQEQNIPDPAALEWLCLFYLTYENVIPSLQKLKNRKRRPGAPSKIIEGNERCKAHFFKDPDFLRDWQEKTQKNMPEEESQEYVLNLLQLASGFFSLFSATNFKGDVLLTKNGKVVPLLDAIEEGLISSSIDLSRCSDLPSRKAMIKKALEKEAVLKGEMFLMQPFAQRRFVICQRKFDECVRPLMGRTAKMLQTYLKKKTDTAANNDASLEVDLKSLFKCETKKMEIIYGTLKEDEMVASKQITLADLEDPQINNVTEVDYQEDSQHFSNNIQKNTNGMTIASSLDQTQTNQSYLKKQFEALSDEVAVPDREWQSLSDMQQDLNDFLASHGFPGSQLVLFRNRYLKLQPVISETSTIFFVDRPQLYLSDESGSLRVLDDGWTEFENFIGQIKTNNVYPEEIKRRQVSMTTPENGTQQDMPLLSSDKFTFHIASYYLPEVQCCRMVEYYCTFDPRVKPLMTVVYYWAKLNNIRLGKENDDSGTTFTVGETPDPALLEWLVIFFLCQVKILPPPSVILGQSGGAERFFKGVNIGFKTDPEYAREWWNRYEETDEEYHYLNVFMLARDFFGFWSELRFNAMVRPIVIDLKNGNHFEKQVITKNLDNTTRLGLSMETGISLQDLTLLNSEPKIKEGFYSLDEAVTILHPLYINYGFSFCWLSFILKICSKMGATEKKLKKMLDSWKVYVNKDSLEKCSQCPTFSIDKVLNIDV